MTKFGGFAQKECMFLHQMIHRSWRGRRGCVYENETRIHVFFYIWTFLRKLSNTSSHTLTYVYALLIFIPLVFHLTFHLLPGNLKKFETFSFPFHISFHTWLFNHRLESWRNLGGAEGRTKTENQAKATYNSKIGIEYLTSFSGLPALHLTNGVTGGRGVGRGTINLHKLWERKRVFPKEEWFDSRRDMVSVGFKFRYKKLLVGTFLLSNVTHRKHCS